MGSGLLYSMSVTEGARKGKSEGQWGEEAGYSDAPHIKTL